MIGGICEANIDVIKERKEGSKKEGVFGGRYEIGIAKVASCRQACMWCIPTMPLAGNLYNYFIW